jgi:hypothetical protein
MKTDPRVDAYIQRAPAFAQPILVEVRKRVHRAVPDATETIKWNVPFYELSGKLLASMAAFKKHTKIGVWHGMKPNMVDVTELSHLPSAAEHVKNLQAAADYARTNGKASSPAAKKASTATPSKKTVAKKATAKKGSAKKPMAKKPPVKKAPKHGR